MKIIVHTDKMSMVIYFLRKGKRMIVLGRKMALLIQFSLVILMFNASVQENDKKKATDLYDKFYEDTRMDQIPWNGSINSCDPGTLSGEVLQKAEDRINYFRLAAGLSPVAFSEEFNIKAQLTALLMTANGRISHTPDENWKCFTDSGGEGAKNSNLGISDFENFPDLSFITGFILDYGVINSNIGHRKWLLNSRAERMGYGATGKHEAIYVTGLNTAEKQETPAFIAYPPAGYFPYSLIFEKWSFGFPAGMEADFKKAKVEMSDEQGKKLSVRILSTEDPWYFDPTIVWQAEDLFSEEEIKFVKNTLPERGYLDRVLKIRISNVFVNREKRTFEYSVIPFDPGE